MTCLGVKQVLGETRARNLDFTVRCAFCILLSCLSGSFPAWLQYTSQTCLRLLTGISLPFQFLSHNWGLQLGSPYTTPNPIYAVILASASSGLFFWAAHLGSRAPPLCTCKSLKAWFFILPSEKFWHTMPRLYNWGFLFHVLLCPLLGS